MTTLTPEKEAAGRLNILAAECDKGVPKVSPKYAAMLAADIRTVLSALRASHETETANDDLGPSAPWCAFINPEGYRPDPLEPPAAADSNHKCACGAVGFKPSAIPCQCEFCDGTEGGVGPTGAEP